MDDENKDLTLLLLITAGIAICGFFLFSFAQTIFIPDLKVNSYDVSFSWDGTLQESYLYNVHISDYYRSLNRKFESPVYSTIRSDSYIRFISVAPPSGTIGYVKEADGTVTLTGENTGARSIITDRAGRNEAGAFNPGYFRSGTYLISYTWDIVPPVERGTDGDHLNIDLATTHIPYDSVRIQIPAPGVTKLYPHPADLTVTRSGDSYILTGSVSEDIPLGFEVLIDPSVTASLNGQVRPISGSVRERTEQANPWYLSVANPLYRLISALSSLLLFGIPVLLLGIWYRYGREKSYTVPDHLSFVPDPSIKPWLVSLVFSGDPGKFPEEGLHATLIDLHRRGIISIQQQSEKDFSIRVLKNGTGDRYEEQVIRTLSLLSEDGIVTNETFTRMASDANANESMRTQLVEFQRSFRDLPTGIVDQMISAYIRNGHTHLIPLLILAVGVFFVSLVLIIIGPGDRLILGSAV